MMQSNVNEICSIKDLLNILNSLGEVEQGKTRFFRGHSKSSYLIQPSIYRESYLIENEDKIIRDALTYCPDDFSPNDTLFQKLVKLQHYGYATRLLDLTTNALVALYFAISSKESVDKDGELIILDIPNEEIKYDDSDTVSIISAIGILNFNTIHDFDEYIKLFSEEAINFTKSWHENFINTIKNNPNMLNPNKLIELIYNPAFTRFIETENKLEVFNKNEMSNNTLNLSLMQKKCDNKDIHYANKFIDSNSETYFVNLLNQYQNYFIQSINNPEGIYYPVDNLLSIIRNDKPYFINKINPFDLRKVICVRAKLNNARIVRQQGCFLLFGIQDSKEMPAVMPSEWKREIDGQKIIIKNKQHIMQELKSFGISKQTLFPELERQAEEIMAQYKPK